MKTQGELPRPVVLVVDDEPQLLDLLTTEMSGVFELATASSASEAHKLMSERSFDAVVCDHMMPGEEGLQFLIRAKDEFPGTMRILVTGYMNPEFISRSRVVAGLSACLIKPVRVADISQAIRSVLQR